MYGTMGFFFVLTFERLKGQNLAFLDACISTDVHFSSNQLLPSNSKTVII
jgi:hypothetical protein